MRRSGNKCSSQHLRDRLSRVTLFLAPLSSVLELVDCHFPFRLCKHPASHHPFINSIATMDMDDDDAFLYGDSAAPSTDAAPSAGTLLLLSRLMCAEY
jgi:hypothetical protein